MRCSTWFMTSAICVTALITGAPPGAQAQTPNGPTFDCTKAKLRVEQLICENPQLARLDVEMLQTYRQAAAVSLDANALKASQLAWLRMRNACTDVTCLLGAFSGRMSQLNEQAGIAAPVTQNTSVAQNIVNLSQPTNTLRLRAEPNTTANIITLIPHGSPVTVLKRQSDGWWQLRDANGNEGWSLAEQNGIPNVVSSQTAQVTPPTTQQPSMDNSAAAARAKAAEAAAMRPAQSAATRDSSPNAKSITGPTTGNKKAVQTSNVDDLYVYMNLRSKNITKDIDGKYSLAGADLDAHYLMSEGFPVDKSGLPPIYKQAIQALGAEFKCEKCNAEQDNRFLAKTASWMIHEILKSKGLEQVNSFGYSWVVKRLGEQEADIGKHESPIIIVSKPGLESIVSEPGLESRNNLPEKQWNGITGNFPTSMMWVIDSIKKQELSLFTTITLSEIQNFGQKLISDERNKKVVARSAVTDILNPKSTDMNKFGALSLWSEDKGSVCLIKDKDIQPKLGLVRDQGLRDWLDQVRSEKKYDKVIQEDDSNAAVNNLYIAASEKSRKCTILVDTIPNLQKLGKAFERDGVVFDAYPLLVERDVALKSFWLSIGFNTLEEFELAAAIGPNVRSDSMELAALKRGGINSVAALKLIIAEIQAASYQNGPLTVDVISEFLRDKITAKSENKSIIQAKSDRIEREQREAEAAERSRILAEKKNKEAHPYRALIRCSINQTYYSAYTCFIGNSKYGSGSFTLTTAGTNTVFTTADMAQQMGDSETVLLLTKSFDIKAQSNGSDYMVLDIKIVDWDDKVIFQKQASTYGVIYVRN